MRAVVEGRFLSMRAHARELGVGQPSRILATGGGSKNPQVREYWEFRVFDQRRGNLI